jgi:hypothetical protein
MKSPDSPGRFSDLYTHVLDEVKRDAANRMDGLLRDILPPKQ